MLMYINDKKIVDIEMANTPIKKMKGLMGVETVEKGMLFVNANNIHMFFMKTEIDVLYLDKDSKIIHLTEYMKKWTVGPIVFKGKYIIELPKGTIAKYGIKLNDQVLIKE